MDINIVLGIVTAIVVCLAIYIYKKIDD